MKRYLALLIVMLAAALGCKAQIPPNPTVLACPAATGSTYTPVNQSSPATGTTYADTPAAGNWCYIAQSQNNTFTPPLQSVPSNVAGPFTTTANTSSNTVDLSWTAPTTGVAPTGYVISRAPATLTTITAPALGAGTIAEVRKPKATCPKAECGAKRKEQVAKNGAPPLDLAGSLR